MTKFNSVILVAGVFSIALSLSCSQSSSSVNNPVYPNKVGVYSETHSTVSALAQLAVRGNSVVVTTNFQFSEGYEGLQVQIANLGWMRFDMAASVPFDASSYSSGYLNFSIKTTNTNAYLVGVKSADGAETWVPLTSSQFQNDGKWYAVSIPVSAFSNVDLTKVTNFFMITNSNATHNGDIVWIDDVFWSDIAVARTLWNLVWADEFNNTNHAAIDPGNWVYEDGNNGGWGNSELEMYTNNATNSYISNSNLVIMLNFLGGSPTGVNYNSSRIKTQGLHSWQYGRIMARINLVVNAQGAWPAFWMLGNTGTWPANGELDIMECGLGGDFSSIGGTAHWGTDWMHHQYKGTTTALSAGYHIFEIEWNAYELKWYLDGNLFQYLDSGSVSIGYFRQPFFILFNLAIGSISTGYTGNKNPDQTKLPNYMFVDWVRVYQPQ